MNRNYRNSNQQLLSEMKNMLGARPYRRLTLEGLVFGEDGEEMMGGDEEEMPQGGQQMAQGNQQMPMGGQQMPQGGQQMQMGEEGEEENPLDGDPEITELITNIRVETLQGMTKLAQNPESAQYELLKKIFLLVDKAVEDKVDPQKQGQ